MRSPALFAACLLPAALVAFAAAPAPTPAAPTLVVSGELTGHVTPCGCAKPMLGGLPRRASLLRARPEARQAVRIEAGDLVDGATRQEEMKAETIVDMLGVLGYSAIALGEKDFALGRPFLESLAARAPGKLLCANVRQADGSPAFGESVTVERGTGASRRRVAVVAVLSEVYADEVARRCPELRVVPAESAIERLLPDIAGADVRVLVCHAPRDEAARLARRFPGFQVVLFSHDVDRPALSERVGTTALVAAGSNGKYVGLVGLGGRAPTVQPVALGPELPDDADMSLLKRAYLDRVTAEDLLAKAPRVPTPNGDSYAGSAACKQCHAIAHKTWLATAHAHALKTLASVGEDRDPECVSCHVVGFGRTGGFSTARATPGLADVGCESCHGPARRHVRDPKQALGKAGPAACSTCHVPEHSPRFEFAAYWARVRH